MVRNADTEEIETRLSNAVDDFVGIDWLEVVETGSRIEMIICGRHPASEYVAGGEALATVSTTDGDSFDVVTGSGARADHEITKLAATGRSLVEAIEVAADHVRR
jgi:hypothetical protein